jgi:hypothetical protein
MADQAVFDPKKVNILVAGIKITGFADATGFTAVMPDNLVEGVVGNNGLSAYLFSHSRRCDVTFTLMPNSVANAQFSAIFLAQRVTGVAVPIMKNMTNGGFVEGGTGYFVKMPDSSVENAVTPVVWSFLSLNWVKYVGPMDAAPVANTMEEVQALLDAAGAIPAAT